MSLNKKYTWLDFLKEHPEHKEKQTKRTSAEGKKAFEAAYKTFIKKYLVERTSKIEKEIERSKKRREDLTAKLKAAHKSNKKLRIKFAQKKVGRTDRAIAGLGKIIEKTKTLQKNF